MRTGHSCSPLARRSSLLRSTASNMPSAISTASSAWVGEGSGMPAAHMYASPIVLIFSNPWVPHNVSNKRK